MVVNEYTGEFKENKVDLDIDLRSLAAPVLSMRDNEYIIPYGGKLVLNYHVCDYYGAEHPNLDGTVTVGEQSANTFTFIVRIDEDILELDDVPEYKQTTFSGDLVIEIDVSDLTPGVHSILVQAISNGLASPTEWIKFRIMDENEDSVKTKNDAFVLPGNIVDLNSIANGKWFVSEYSGELKTTYVDFDSSENFDVIDNCSNKYVMSYVYRPTDSTYKTFKRVIVADYKVTKNNSNEILIDVDGKIYYTDINRWTGYKRYLQKGMTSTFENGYGPAVYDRDGLSYEDISGTYLLTNTVISNGVTYVLSNYLSKIPTEVPDAVRKAAIRNKFALTRLCEAVQAYFYGDQKIPGRCGVKLPKNMNIVIDYHGFEATSHTISVGDDKVREIYYEFNDNISTDKYCIETSHTKFPDRFVLDLNGSTVSSLQVNDLTSGMMIVIADCYDTHITNGKIQGGYKYRKYSQISNGKLRLAEALGNIMICASEFCSYENVEDYWAVGYDAECVGRNQVGINERTNERMQSYVWRIPFNLHGYIDLDGKIHKLGSVSNYDIVPRYTEGLDDPGTIYNATGTATTYKTDLYKAYNSLLHKVLKSGEDYIYRGRKSFDSNAMYLRGAHNIITHTGDTITGDDAFAYGVSMYIYFYKEFDQHSQVFRDWLNYQNEHNGELPDYEPLEFIKAYKIMPSRPFLVPKNAKYAHLCVTGSYSVNMWTGLKHKDQENYFARLNFNEYLSSWSSGYKNCQFHDNRTSILNNHYAFLCYIKNCNISNLGSGRHLNQGGMSNQPFNIDVEDNSAFAGNLAISNIENVSGSSGANLHHAINILFDNVRNYSLSLQKNIFKGIVKNSYVKINNHLGYSHPIKFMRFNNNMFTTVSVDSDGRGTGRGITFIENSSVENVTFGNTKYKAIVVNKSNGTTTTITNIE